MGTNTVEPPPVKTETKPAVTRRFIACFQSTGRVGKSLTAEGIMMWLRFAEVKHLAIDADAQHQTLSRRHPDVGAFDAARSIDDFGRMVQSLPDAPVVLVDYPAQATAFLLEASRHLRLLDLFEASATRPTLLVFAADDQTAKESAAAVVRHFGDRADYLLIENPARFKSDEFKASPFYRWFAERKTPTIRIPYITVGTMSLWEKLEREEKGFLSFDKVRQHPGMHLACKFELEGVRNRFLTQCEDHAGRIIPDLSLIKKKVARPHTPEPVAVNPLEDEFFA
jgi:hypothetical protein